MFEYFSENLLGMFMFHSNLRGITDIFHEDQYTFLKISRSDLLRMRSVSGRRCK
jgi:hypothetical protein